MQNREIIRAAERIAEKRESEENMAIFGKLAMLAILVGLVVLFLKGPIRAKHD